MVHLEEEAPCLPRNKSLSDSANANKLPRRATTGQSLAGSRPNPRGPHGQGHARRCVRLPNRRVVPPAHLPRVQPPPASAPAREERAGLRGQRRTVRPHSHPACALRASGGGAQ